MMKESSKYTFTILLLTLVFLFMAILIWGPISIPFSTLWEIALENNSTNSSLYNIFWQLRLPKAITALLAGSSLAISGLIMQTFFKNPLAGPFVLGIHSGAALGVALWIMASSALSLILPSYLMGMGSSFFAIIGSLTILLILMLLSNHIPGKVILLIIGLMFGHLASGIINILIVVSEAARIKTFLLWSLGSFSRVVGTDLTIFSIVTSLGLICSLFFVKHLNVLLLGDRYAKSLGLSLKQIKFLLVLLTAILSGTVTAFCGPIAFLGIVAPHIARGWLKSNDHRILLPAVCLLGGIIALFAEFIASFWTSFTLPLNAILGLLGAPVIFLFLWQKRKEGNL